MVALIQWIEAYHRDQGDNAKVVGLRNLATALPAFPPAPPTPLLRGFLNQLGSTVHWINHYPLDKSIGSGSTYPIESDLNAGYHNPTLRPR